MASGISRHAKIGISKSGTAEFVWSNMTTAYQSREKHHSSPAEYNGVVVTSRFLVVRTQIPGI